MKSKPCWTGLSQFWGLTSTLECPEFCSWCAPYPSLVQTAILLNSWSITQCFSCWISNIHAHKQTHRRFCCLAVLIPGTPTRKGWGWVGAFGVSKTEWSRPHPTPNNSFAPFWQMGKKPLPNARPLLQRQKDHQQTKCFCVSECYCNINTINNAKGYWE